MRSKKKVLIVLSVIILLLLLASCYSTAEEVPLATKSEILHYAKELYGRAIYISSTENGESRQHSITYTLQDKEYKFQYEITSSVFHIWLDTTLGYSEQKTSNFENKYIEHIRPIISAEITKNAVQGTTVNFCPEAERPCLFLVETDDVDTGLEAVKQIKKFLKKIDTRKYFFKHSAILSDIVITNHRGNELGTYYLNSDDFIPTQHE